MMVRRRPRVDSLAADFAALVADPSEAAGAIPPEDVPEILGALEKARAALWARLLGRRDEAPPRDRLLTIDEAAARLAVATNWLRRRSDLPFVVRLSEGNVRYSEQGIERFIQRQQRS
jgi:hypothetical protein